MNEQWERLAIWGKGTTGVIAQSALDPKWLYAGTGAGVNLSTDSGVTWRLPVASESPVLIEALVAARIDNESELVFAGGPTGLYRSNDRGETWDPVLQTVHVRALTVIQSAYGSLDYQILLAATDQDGVLRSDVRGETWSASNPGLLDRTVLSLATTVDGEGRELALAGTVSGIFLSRNAARAWKPVFVGDEGTDIECFAVVPRSDGGRTWFAASTLQGLLRSDDGGLTWNSVTAFPRSSAALIAVVESIDAEPTLAVSADDEVFLSKDGGANWELAGAFTNSVMSLAALLENGVSGALLAGPSDGGIIRFDPVSRQWSPSDSGLHATL